MTDRPACSYHQVSVVGCTACDQLARLTEAARSAREPQPAPPQDELRRALAEAFVKAHQHDVLPSDNDGLALADWVLPVIEGWMPAKAVQRVAALTAENERLDRLARKLSRNAAEAIDERNVKARALADAEAQLAAVRTLYESWTAEKFLAVAGPGQPMRVALVCASELRAALDGTGQQDTPLDPDVLRAIGIDPHQAR